MSEQHPHVDLTVLQLVEEMLSRPDDAAAAEETGQLVHLPSTETAVRDRSAAHPAAHVPEQPVIAKEPVTPLARRR